MAAMRPRVRADLAVVELDGEAVVYDERSSQLHLLNPTATLVFKLCDGSVTVKELAADMADVFSVPVQDVEREIRALLRGFRKTHLLDGLE